MHNKSYDNIKLRYIWRNNMKRTIKIIIFVFLSIIVLYALFITEECIRLSHNKLSKPLIVFNETFSGPNGDITYQSLGFK